MDILSNFSERLGELMEEGGYSGEKLAAAIGVSGHTVRAWLHGGTFLSLANGVRLADLFRCTLDYLVGRQDDMREVQPHPLPPFYGQLLSVLAARGVTKYRVTADTSIKDSHFYNWKRGKQPKLATVCVLANYLGLSLDELVGR